MSDMFSRVTADEALGYVDRIWNRYIDDLSRLIAIPSVVDERDVVEGAPWGRESRRALDCALEIATDLGLKCNDGGGYLGWADVPGSFSSHIAGIAHIDVVPAGNGWYTDPFSLVRRDGYLLGRGVLDDKGAAVAMLYAASFFIGRSDVLPIGIRCLLGAAEEAGMKDVRWYNAHNEQPLFCFTPDAEFSVCCGEKGGLNAQFEFPMLSGSALYGLWGGAARNAVPDYAEAIVRADLQTLPTDNRIEVRGASNGYVKICARGIGGHAAMPEGSVNAIGLLVAYLLRLSIWQSEERAFFELESKLLDVTDGSGLGIAASDDQFDPLTCVGTMIFVEDGKLIQHIDIRFPRSITVDEIDEALRHEAILHGCAYRNTHSRDCYFVDPERPEIRALLASYEEVFGKPGKAFTIGGGTYAHHFDRAVSFGPLDSSVPSPEWVGPEHGANEGIAEDMLRMAMATYILAFDKLIHGIGAVDM